MQNFEKELTLLEQQMRNLLSGSIPSEGRRLVENLIEQLLEHRGESTTRFSSGNKLMGQLIDEQNNFLMADDQLFSCKPYIFEYEEYQPQVNPARSEPKVYRKSTNNKGGRKPADPSMEYELSVWIIREIESGRTPNSKAIIEEARAFCKVGEFKFSKGWFCRFKARLLKQMSENISESVRQVVQDL